MPFFIILIFYSYTAILKRNFLILDILTFIVAVVFGQIISYKIMFLKKIPKIYNQIAIIFLFLLFSSFVIFTFYPLPNFLFRAPITFK